MPLNEEKLGALLDRTVADLSANYCGVMMSLGHKLGLYKAMAGAGPLDSHEVAKRADCAERYVREWLNSQAAGGYVDYHKDSQTYELSPEQTFVLADETSPSFFPPAFNVPASMWLDEDKAIHAFQTGDGVPWGDHNGRLFCGVAAFFRAAYQGNLVPNWLPMLDGVTDRLGEGIHVADIGCGHGHSTLIMADAFPNSTFTGIDVHEPSVVEARDYAKAAGVGERVKFETGTAQNYGNGPFDLICFFDCLHDLGDPVGAARYAAKNLNEGGTVMLIEPFASDLAEENFNPVGRMYYAASTTICCAHSLSEDVGLALGAQAGETRLADVFREAGFSHFRRAGETPFNLIIEARL